MKKLILILFLIFVYGCSESSTDVTVDFLDVSEGDVLLNPADVVAGKAVELVDDKIVSRYTCKDTDNGFDVEVRGTVTGTVEYIDGTIVNVSAETDKCGLGIVEYFCRDHYKGKRPSKYLFDCNCVDGVCV